MRGEKKTSSRRRFNVWEVRHSVQSPAIAPNAEVPGRHDETHTWYGLVIEL